MKRIKKIINIVLIALLSLSIVVVSLIPSPQQAYAIGPIVKVVGGEALDQVFQGMAYKLGQSFNDESSLDKARGRWNLDGYEKAKAYESQMNAEEKARWDKFNSEVNNAKVEPIPGKPHLGKILLSGAAFLTGADLIYNSYKAFQSGVAGSGQMEVADFLTVVSPTNHPGVGFTYTSPSDPHVSARGTLVVRTSDGQTITKSNILLSTRSNAPYTYKVEGNKVSILSNNGGVINGNVFTFPSISTNLDIPKMNIVPVTATDTAVNVPDAFADVPRVAELPDISSIAEVNPDSVVEIIVPLDPGIKPTPSEVPPLTKDELDYIRGIEPGTPPEEGTDPDKPPGTDPDGDPDKPPGTDPDGDPDKPPGTDPDGDTDAPPKEDEETPPGEDGEQPPKEDEENSCDASLKKPDFKKVGVAFTNAFPFSLPWDLKRFFDAAFSGIGSEKPSVDLTFLGDGVTLTIPDYFDSWVDVAKNLMVILFDISLIWMFARFMQRGGGD